MIVGKPRKKEEITFVPVGDKYAIRMLPVEFDSVPISQYYLLVCVVMSRCLMRSSVLDEISSSDFSRLFCMLPYSS